MSRGARLLIDRRGRLGSYADALEQAAVAALRRGARVAGLGVRHEISLVLCDNPTIRAINRQWRNIDRPTDVLSFPLYELTPGEVPPEGPIGDIVISLPTVRRAARELGETEERHIERLAVHGLAHLLGHDHHDDDEAARMTDFEEQLLGREIAR